ALEIRAAVIPASHETRVTGALPRLCEARREVLRVSATIEGAFRVRPDLPGRSRRFQALEEPGLLPDAQDRLRGLIPANIRDFGSDATQMDRRLAAVVGPTRVENGQRLLRPHLWKFRDGQRRNFRLEARVLRTVRVLIGDEQIDMTPPTKGAVAHEAVDGGEVVGL